MAQLRQDYQKFVERDTKIIVIGPDDHNEFRKYWSKENLPFIGIPDPKRKVIKLYRQKVKLLKLGRMPAQFVVDRQGVIKYAHYSNSMSDIPSNDEILELLGSIPS